MFCLPCILVLTCFTTSLILQTTNGRVLDETVVQPFDEAVYWEEQLLDDFPPEAIDYSQPKASGCQINVNGHMVEPQPLILEPGKNQYLMPNDSHGAIYLNANQKIELFCSNAFFKFNTTTHVNLTCSKGTKFNYEGKQHDFREFNCTKYPAHVAKRTGAKCFENASVVHVGFEVDNRFLKVYEICFDEVNERTHYVTHEFTPGYLKHQFNFPRPSWYSTGFYQGKKVDTLYVRDVQRQTLTKILNSKELAKKYIPDTGDFYMARGHIAAKSDFVFGNHQRTSFWLMNASPQWQVFNAGNWLAIENAIKKFVAKRNIEVDAYTGTYGTTTLLDEKSKPHEIYLAFDKNNNGLVPAPKLYYKTLVDRKSKKGIVLIGVNNPYLPMKLIEKDYIICKDVGDQINWIKWDKNNITAGYSYACDVNEFMKVVKHLPNLKVTGLLI